MEIFVFISCGVQTKTFKVEAGGCKSIKAYHLFAIGNLNVNNTDWHTGVKIISTRTNRSFVASWELNRVSKEDSLQKWPSQPAAENVSSSLSIVLPS